VFLLVLSHLQAIKHRYKFFTILQTQLHILYLMSLVETEDFIVRAENAAAKSMVYDVHLFVSLNTIDAVTEKVY